MESITFILWSTQSATSTVCERAPAIHRHAFFILLPLRKVKKWVNCTQQRATCVLWANFGCFLLLHLLHFKHIAWNNLFHFFFGTFHFGLTRSVIIVKQQRRECNAACLPFKRLLPWNERLVGSVWPTKTSHSVWDGFRDNVAVIRDCRVSIREKFEECWCGNSSHVLSGDRNRVSPEN